MELIDYMKAYALLKKYNIKSVESAYVKSAKEATAFSGGKAIVLKALSQKALHKTKSKLVELNLTGEREIATSYNLLLKRANKFKPYRIIAQKMVKKGTEIIIGGSTDPQFGKMILLGLGGIYVETFKDFALRVCPITKHDAESMLQQLKSKSIVAPNEKITGQITALLLNTSRMFLNTKTTELDLNPVIIHDDTYEAVDLRLINDNHGSKR